MPASFQLTRNDQQQYSFRLVDNRGEMLLMSGDYEVKEEALQAIDAVRVGSLTANQIAAGKVPAGDIFFVIKDTAGDVLVKSLLFSDRMRFDHALHTVKDDSCVAEIQDLT